MVNNRNLLELVLVHCLRVVLSSRRIMGPTIDSGAAPHVLPRIARHVMRQWLRVVRLL